MTKAVVCLDIGGSFIKSGLSVRPGEIAAVKRVPMPVNDWTAFCDAVQTLLNEYRALSGDDAPLAISTAGLVDADSGEVYASNIPAFHYRRVAETLQRHLARPVVVANDADCFVLAEAVAGKGQGERIVFGAILGSGVGGGLVIDGNIIQGTAGICGEWGHGPIMRTALQLADESEPLQLPRLPCACGQQGCLDTVGGARGIERLYQQLYGEALSSQQIVTAWHAGQARAQRTLVVWCELVSEPLAWVLNVTGAARVVVGGGMASEPALIALLDRRVKQLILRRTEQPLVVVGQFAENGGLIGASVLGHRHHPR
ncbi:N-acetylglucosamine kinase [Paramixta manurensis]|uniref:N-acetyl-D-glucosamine kinase n=1 Tax=Paramixta manurensis TaxID=2740817 RepID=A0A6M8UE40_9GAMM|nr:N-acetylglucosamine kinase [Erwiniaceae bacterium PD-1]